MTTMLKKEAVQRKWYVLDAAGKPMGRVAATAAKLLRGKHKVDFTPNVDCGDLSSSSTPTRLSSPARSSIRSTTIITPAGSAT